MVIPTFKIRLLAIPLTFLSFLALAFPGALLAEGTKVHVIGMYEGPEAGPGPKVVIKNTDEPVLLVLSSYERSSWWVVLKPGARLAGVILNGYEEQSVSITNSVRLRVE